jgi:hypothetical protein
MITPTDKKTQNCWEFMNCPIDTKYKCNAYRMNIGKECWFEYNIEKEIEKNNPNY